VNAVRTTIELSDKQRQLLYTIAAQRGLRGFSKIIEEALESYFDEYLKKQGESALLLRGAWSDEEGQLLQKSVRELKAQWKV